MNATDNVDAFEYVIKANDLTETLKAKITYNLFQGATVVKLMRSGCSKEKIPDSINQMHKLEDEQITNMAVMYLQLQNQEMIRESTDRNNNFVERRKIT